MCKIFSNANVFVFFVVKGCTDSLEPIDVGIGWCMRVYVGHALDDWLSVDDNLLGSLGEGHGGKGQERSPDDTSSPG